MATMNISLPDELKDFIDRQVAENAYTSSSEYIRSLVRARFETSRFEALVDEGIRAPIVAEADDAYFESKREYVRQAAAARRAKA